MEFTATLEEPTDCGSQLNDFINGFFGDLTSQYTSAVLAPEATPAVVEPPKEDSSALQNYFSSFRDGEDDTDSGFTDISTRVGSPVDIVKSTQTYYEMDGRMTNAPTLNVDYQSSPVYSYPVPEMTLEIPNPVDSRIPTPQYSVPQLMEIEPAPTVDMKDVLPSRSEPSSILNCNEKLQRKSKPHPVKSKKSKKIKPPVVPGKFYCAQCDKNFLSGKGLLQHNNSQHTGVKAHRCDDCGKMFDRAEDRDRHQARHVMSNKPFPCPYDDCPRAYNRAYDLNRHIADHHGTPKFGCTQCEMRYSREDHLMKHEESHKINTVKKFKKRRV